MARVGPRPDSGCWMWLGSDQGKGYGNVGHEGRTQRAHRVSYKLFVGPIPDGLHVLHKCDVRLCVNPDHLFLGTNADNVRDMVEKGRNNFGERNGNAKLTEDKVRDIRAGYELGDTVASLSLSYQVSCTAIYDIVRGDTWRHVS